MSNSILSINNKSIRGCFFGLKKSNVNNIIEQLQRDEAEKIKQMEKGLHELNTENKRLFAELDKLAYEIESEMKEQSFMEYCLRKSDCYSDLFKQAADKEIAEAVTIGYKIQNLFDEKIKEFEQSIKETQTILEALLKDVAYKNENIEERLLQFMKQEGSYKFLSPKQPENITVPIPNIEINEPKNTQPKLESQAISKEISSIRNKYLIGKIAGADLVDLNGNTIVSKSEMITIEVVDKAEQQGKLAELIVNMTLPEIEM